MKILGRQDLAEEAVQDAYVTIWKQAARFDPSRGSARGWMSIITRRRAIDRLRASPWLQRELPEQDDFIAVEGNQAEALTLRHCLDQLDRRTRHAICLAYLYGMTHQELSDRTQIPLGTLKSRLRRGLFSLRECLDQ